MTTKRAFWLPCECGWLPPLEASQRPLQRPQCRSGPSCWRRAWMKASARRYATLPSVRQELDILPS
jgi:hypothetical protein